MSPTTTAVAANLGFLTILHEANGFLGGYLVTNLWGRPLEFRLSTAVQPNRVQQILYGGTLQPYICAELIGKTLVEKTSTPIQLIVTDHQPVLELRTHLDIPVVWLAPKGETGQNGSQVRPAEGERGPVYRHPRFPADDALIRNLLDRIDESIDLTEPFTRVREAIGEARKMGVTQRS